MASSPLRVNGGRRGVLSGVAAVGLLLLAAFPARLGLALRGWGSVISKVERTFGGTLLDLSAVVWLVVPVVALLAMLVPLVVARVRGARWQALGAPLLSLPFGLALWVLTVAAQEVKSERGSFPTVFDLLEGGTNASFIEGSLGFFRYERVWFPAAVATCGVAVILVVLGRKRGLAPVAWRSWGVGLSCGLLGGALLVWGLAAGLGSAINRFSPAALGDPLTGLVESTVDLLQRRGPSTPRELVLTAELPPGSAAKGAALLGWPPAREGAAHLHVRHLPFSSEPPTSSARGRALVDAFARIGAALFSESDPNVAVFHLSLEGFRSDDVHALNPLAPKEIAPFTTALYEGRPGVITSRRLYQAGVRTAHCLGAMTCGVGTLPYNLSFIRDLQPFPVRCVSDVAAEAGFAHSFFYGSDGSFDDMHGFFATHGYTTLVTQKELPAGLPKGTWEGVTDFAVFDEAVQHVAKGLATGPQFSLVMSLSNHSPFTAPEDLPASVLARVDASLKTAVHRADADDRLRLITYSYTDAAVERLFGALESAGIAERSIVFLMADHSTGHAYVWGKEDPESDAAKSQIPFAMVIPPAFLARAKDPAALTLALADAARLLDEGPLSQNDVPTLMLALLQSHPGLVALPQTSRWHTLGGQVTSPWFQPGGDSRTSILGINGVSELFALDAAGDRLGGYEDSVFLKTRADRYRVTPRLIPITATLTETMRFVK